jgi:hypothetical protein
MVEERIWAIRPLTVAGAAQAGRAMCGDTSLLPVELRHVNHPASTNAAILKPFFPPGHRPTTSHAGYPCAIARSFVLSASAVTRPTIARCMATPSTTDLIADRVERLLLRHDELQRTNTLLTEQVAELTLERDSLKSRLSAARARVDALLERLPVADPATKESP